MRTTISYRNAALTGLISACQVAFFLFPSNIDWRMFVSIVGGAFITPFAVLLHLPPPSIAVAAEEAQEAPEAPQGGIPG